MACSRLLPAYQNLFHITPQAHRRIAHAVDRAVFPLRRRGRKGRGVGVVGRGVGGQRPPARAAVHLQLQQVEKRAEALPAPADEDRARLHPGRDESRGAEKSRRGPEKPCLLDPPHH